MSKKSKKPKKPWYKNQFYWLLFTSTIGLCLWSAKRWVEHRDERIRQEERQKFEKETSGIRSQEQEAKELKERDRRAWESIDSRLDTVFQFVKASDKYVKKSVPTSSDRLAISAFVFKTQKDEHKKLWARLMDGVTGMSDKDDVGAWSRQVTKYETIESKSHDDFKGWALKHSWMRFVDKSNSKVVRLNIAVPVASLNRPTMVGCDNCNLSESQLEIHPISNGSDRMLSGVVVQDLPLTLGMRYPYFNLSSKEIREKFGDALGEEMEGFFVPAVGHIVPTSQSPK